MARSRGSCDSFEDKRLRQLARRLLYLERPEALDDVVKAEFDVAIAKRLLTTDKVPWLTLPQAIEEADVMLDTLGGANADRVRELMEYLKVRMAVAASLVAERHRSLPKVGRNDPCP